MNDRWPETTRLRALWEESGDADKLFDESLSALINVLQADRAIIFLGHASGSAEQRVSETVSPLRGRDRDGSVTQQALEDASRTIVERCIAERRIVTWDASGDPQHGSTAALGLLTAIAAPIGDPPRGALYVDFRRARYARGAQQVYVFEELAGLFHAALTRTDFKPSSRPKAPQHPAPPDLSALLSLPGLFAMAETIRMAVDNTAPVLVLGETGTGKTLLAEAFARRLHPKAPVRAMLGTSDDPNTVVAELFGVVRGAATDVAARPGLVELADGGVLIFDEVLNLPLAVQPLLLDFTQFGTYRPLGHREAHPKRANVRILAVTNGDLERAVREGRFREDLYHRLAGTVLRIPPLRERRGDIPGLAAILLPRVAPGEAWKLSLDARRALVSERHAWPGNVRQFEGALRRAVERARVDGRGEVTRKHLDEELRDDAKARRKVAKDGASPPVEAPTGDDFKARYHALQSRKAALLKEEDALLLEADAASETKLEAVERLGFEKYTTFVSRVKRLKGEASKRPPDTD